MTDRVTEEEFQAARNAFADADWYRNGFDAALRAAISAVKPKNEWKTIESAPKDGRPFIGGFWGIRWADSHRKGDVVTCWWQEEFEAFVSSCREMVLAEGYAFDDGSTSKLHSPTIEPVTHWIPLPCPPESAQ